VSWATEPGSASTRRKTLYMTPTTGSPWRCLLTLFIK
jgi:hypothetical protein